VHITPINYNNEHQQVLADEISALFQVEGYEVLLDDRKERPGVKFTDAELMGIPIRITVGKKAEDDIVELVIRKTGEMVETKKDDLINTIAILMASQEESN
jgi:prolyl-tRNA synthetase